MIKNFNPTGKSWHSSTEAQWEPSSTGCLSPAYLWGMGSSLSGHELLLPGAGLSGLERRQKPGGRSGDNKVSNSVIKGGLELGGKKKNQRAEVRGQS